MLAILIFLISALAAFGLPDARMILDLHVRQEDPFSGLAPISQCTDACKGITDFASSCGADMTSCKTKVCSADYLKDYKSCMDCMAGNANGASLSGSYSDLEQACKNLNNDMTGASPTATDLVAGGDSNVGSVTATGAAASASGGFNAATTAAGNAIGATTSGAGSLTAPASSPNAGTKIAGSPLLGLIAFVAFGLRL